MNTEQKTSGLRRLLRDCPEVLTPIQAARWTHQSKNTVYTLIHSGTQGIKASIRMSSL